VNSTVVLDPGFNAAPGRWCVLALSAPTTPMTTSGDAALQLHLGDRGAVAAVSTAA